jgi:formylmethanofuran dehydrogenase subunit E
VAAIASSVNVIPHAIKHVDLGKMAAVFQDAESGEAVRVYARADARQYASRYLAGTGISNGRLATYRSMLDNQLLRLQSIQIESNDSQPLQERIEGVSCGGCGEHVFGSKEVIVNGQPRCRSCAGESYSEANMVVQRT